MNPLDPSAAAGPTTFINPVGLAVTLLMGVLLIVLPRRYALLPIIVMTCYMTMGMRFVFLGLNFTMLRILLLFGWTRLIVRGEVKSIKFNPLDKTLVIWVIVSVVVYTLLMKDYDAFKNKLGLAYNALGFYFMFRLLLRDIDEISKALRIYALLIVPVAVCMIYEKMTGRDMFAVFGGVPPITVIRDGALRCQAAFGHPILAGTFGATLTPIFIGVWLRKEKWRFFAALAIVATVVITVTSASSGPLLTTVAALLALSLWPFRLKMRTVRWGIVAGLAGLQMVMNAPIWFILGKVDIVAGSTGYHRAYLIDRAIANISGWWLIGTNNTWDWADRDQHLFDVTNAYIVQGTEGGLITMILFIAIIVLAFKAIGRTIRLTSGRAPEKDICLLWAMGAALFAHAATYLSVSYFDQNIINWYLLLAMISTLGGASLLMPREVFLEQLDLQNAGETGNRLPLSPANARNRLQSGMQPRLSVNSKFPLGRVPTGPRQ